MTSADNPVLQAGDRFRLRDGRIHTAVMVIPDALGSGSAYVVTDTDGPPMWIDPDDVQEILI